MFTFVSFLIFITLGYLSGSVCSAIIVAKVFSLPDPRSEGSKNPGATNVLRLAGKKYAAMVLLGDMLKGLLPVVVAQLCHASTTILGFTCLAAVVGHVYPIFFGFQGGKGVATALGALLGMQFMSGVLAIAIWLLVANFTRYASLASIISLLFAPFFVVFGTQSPNAFLPLILMTALVLYKHHKNIRLLIDGKEHKISLKHHRLADVTDAILKEGYEKEAPTKAAEGPNEKAAAKAAPFAKATSKKAPKTREKK